MHFMCLNRSQYYDQYISKMLIWVTFKTVYCSRGSALLNKICQAWRSFDCRCAQHTAAPTGLFVTVSAFYKKRKCDFWVMEKNSIGTVTESLCSFWMLKTHRRRHTVHHQTMKGDTFFLKLCLYCFFILFIYFFLQFFSAIWGKEKEQSNKKGIQADQWTPQMSLKYRWYMYNLLLLLPFFKKGNSF